MSALSLRLPESLHAQVRELAERDNVSINQFVTLAVAEKVAVLRTLDYIEQRGQRGSRERNRPRAAEGRRGGPGALRDRPLARMSWPRREQRRRSGQEALHHLHR